MSHDIKDGLDSTHLGNILNIEPLRELSPDLRPEAVAKHDPNLVVMLLFDLGRGQEVPTDFSNVLGRLKECLSVSTSSLINLLLWSMRSLRCHKRKIPRRHLTTIVVLIIHSWLRGKKTHRLDSMTIRMYETYRHIVLDTVSPEGGGRKLFLDDCRGAAGDARGRAHLTSGGMVQGQVAVDDVVVGQANGAVTGKHGKELSERQARHQTGR